MCRVTKAATGRLFFGYFLFDLDAGGRIASGTAIESNAGAVAEAAHKFAWSEFEQLIRLARGAKTREGFRNEKYLALGGETLIQASVAAATP